MKPAHCSYAFGPSFATFSSWFLEVKAPFSSRYVTIFFAIVFVIPEMYSSSEAEAVFKSTPTRFTAVSTTPVSASLKCF